MPTVIESLQEFTERSGGEPVANAKGLEHGALLFPTGAIALRSERPPDKPELIEPPSEAIQNIRRRGVYWSTRVRLAEQTFQAFKENSLGLGFHDVQWHAEFWGPRPEGDDVEILSALKIIVAKERAAFQKVKAELDKHPEIVRMRAEQEAATQKRHEQEMAEMERRHSLSAINI